MGYETLLEQVKAVCAWNSLRKRYQFELWNGIQPQYFDLHVQEAMGNITTHLFLQ